MQGTRTRRKEEDQKEIAVCPSGDSRKKSQNGRKKTSGNLQKTVLKLLKINAKSRGKWDLRCQDLKNAGADTSIVVRGGARKRNAGDRKERGPRVSLLRHTASRRRDSMLTNRKKRNQKRDWPKARVNREGKAMKKDGRCS